MAHTSGARFGGALLVIAAAILSCSDPGGPSESAATRALLDSLGAYKVVPLGAPPVAGTVSFADINDSNVVAGYVIVAGAAPSSYPFRWANGVYQVLSATGSSPRASGINNKGDVVGQDAVPVIWPAGATQRVEIAPPESTTYRRGGAIDISDDGRILFSLDAVAGVALVTRSPFTRVAQMTGTQWPTINGTGLVALRFDATFYPFLYVWDPVANKTCTMGAHGYTTPIALNDRGEVLYSIINTIPPGYSEFQVATYAPGSTCASVRTVAEWKDGNTLRSMNNRRIVTGMIDNVPSVGIVGGEAWVSLDAVLKLSGNGAEDWHVTDVYRVTNSDVFVASAQRAGQTQQLVLLVPAGR